MRWFRWSIVVALWIGLAMPAAAGFFFNRKPQANPQERVPALISTLRTDNDERKRASAADELKQFDANANPEIVPALSEIAMHDPSVSVRIQAVQSLGHIRPISQRAGWVLEQAASHDPSTRVQWQARTLLVQYRLSGYHGSKGVEPPPAPRMMRTDEPPLAPPLPTPMGHGPQGRMVPQPSCQPVLHPTAVRIPMAPMVVPAPTVSPTVVQPSPPVQPAATTSSDVPQASLPASPAPLLTPTEAPHLEEPPTPPVEEGPDLGSPN